MPWIASSRIVVLVPENAGYSLRTQTVSWNPAGRSLGVDQAACRQDLHGAERLSHPYGADPTRPAPGRSDRDLGE